MAQHLWLLAQYSTRDAHNAGAFGGACCFGIVWLAIVVLVIVGWWKLFEKAGKPGWAAIVPIYNLIILCEIAGRPAWWVILFLIPVVNLIAAILIGLDVAKAFGKSELFGVGLALLGPIFYPMLGFSDAQYQGPPPH